MMTPHNLVSRRNLPSVLTYFVALALLTGFSVLALPAAGQGSSQGQVQTAARSKVPRPPNPLGSAGIENSGSTQPRVVFEDGQLTINAADSSLADVLYALRACTGADIDIPPGASSERVTAQLGPGPARKVLADLLGWSSFDYVIQGAENDPLSIQSVTLMLRVKSAPSTSPGVPAAVRPSHSAAATPPVETAPAPVEVPEVENHVEVPAAAAGDTSAPTSQGAQSKPSDMSSPGSSAGKSPADMIQELQQMYQQRRVLQEQQNHPAPPVPTSSQ